MTLFRSSEESSLSFETGPRTLFGDGAAPEQIVYNSGNDFVLRSGPQQFNLVDIDAGPFGALSADGFLDLVFGYEITASLGGLPSFETGLDVSLDAEFAPIIFRPADTFDTSDETQTFTFSNVEVLSARSASQGLGADVTFTDVRGEERTASAGLDLSIVAGITAGFRDIYTRAPFSTSGNSDADGFDLISVPEFTNTVFSLDGTKAVTIELGDFFDLNLRVPTGASTSGTSQGSTIVSDKGFSPQSFIELVGDLDLMLTRGLANIPGVGVVAKALEKSVFFSFEADLSEDIPFLEKDDIKLEVNAVDVSGYAGLKVTEEVTVDYGFRGDIQEGLSFDIGSEYVETVRGLVRGDDLNFDPGEGKAPNLRVTLVSDNGTPDDFTDDRVVQGTLDEELTLPTPAADFDINSETLRQVTVDAFFDVDQAQVVHEVGLGGSWQVQLTVLTINVRGNIGSALGVSLGPLFQADLPDEAFDIGLIDILQNTVALRGGEYALAEDGRLADPDAGDRLSQLGFDPDSSDFGAPAQQQYEYLYSAVRPSGFDPSSPDAKEQLIAFALAVEERFEAANEVMDPFLPDDVTNVRLIAENLDALDDPSYLLEASALRNQFGTWTAANAGETADVKLRTGFDGARTLEDEPPADSDRNFVIAAPALEEGSGGSGLSFEQTVVFNDGSGSVRNRTVTLTSGSDPERNEALSSYFSLLELQQANFESGNDQRISYRYELGDQAIESGTGFQSITDARPNDPFQPLAINVLGTDKRDIVVYTGATPPTDGGTPENPVYLDGGGGNSLSDRDIFVADFGIAHPGTTIVWDMRAQELAELDKSTITIEDYFGDGKDAIVGDFAGTTLQFRRPDGSVSHETVVRDLENYVLRLGDGADVIRTATSGSDYIEMGGGDDVLGISADTAFAIFGDQPGGFGGPDRFSLDAGNDVAIVFRTLVSTDNINPANAERPTLLSGGIGIDEVLVTSDPDPANSAFGGGTREEGVGWRITRQGDSLTVSPDDPAYREPMTRATLDLADAWGIAAELTAILAPDDPDRADRDVWTDVEQTELPGERIDIFYAGRESNLIQIGADVEEISFSGEARGADVVFYLGGDLYRGGTLGTAGTPEPSDLFVADFGLWEGLKAPLDGVSLAGVVIDGTAPDAGGTGLAGAEIEGFEVFAVRGTSASDVLEGGGESDLFDGAGGNDRLIASAGVDTLIGGAGDDIFIVDMGRVQPLATAILGDAPEGGDFNSIDLDVPVARQDADLLILRPDAAAELDGGDRGLRYAFGNDPTVDLTLTASSSLSDLGLLAPLRTATSDDIVSILLSYGTGPGVGAVGLVGVEHTNLEGTDAHDDVMIYDGGATYLMGERAGDADLFVADFSGQSSPVELLVDDAPADGTGAQRLENGTLVAGIDRLFVTMGEDADTVRGGALDDRIDGGGGDDAITGEGGDDLLLGGAGRDLFYWEGDDGTDTIEGGTDSDAGGEADRLIVSNIEEGGAAFAPAGMRVRMQVERDDGRGIRLFSTESDLDDLARILGEERDYEDIGILIGLERVQYTEIEAVDIAGSNEFDDLIVYQDGEAYSGGESNGDADIFVADLFDATADLTLSAAEPIVGARLLQDIGTGTRIAGFERLVVQLGTGDDEVTGGRLDDLIRTGAGDDTVNGSLGSDALELGAGDDSATFLGDSLSVDGGDDRDRLQIGALQTGMETLELTDGSGIAAFEAGDLAALAQRREDLASLVALASSGAGIRQTHADGVLEFEGIEFVTASGDAFADIFVAGSEGAVLSGDGGQDILIGLGGDDFLVGGQGRDAYVFGADFGRDVIANEIVADDPGAPGNTGKINEVHLLGRDLADAQISAGLGRDLIILFDSENTLTIRDYFAVNTDPKNFIFFHEGAPGGETLDREGLVSVAAGSAKAGRKFIGTEADDIVEFVSDGADLLFGFGGNDVFLSSASGDLFDGGTGRDAVSFASVVPADTPGAEGVFIDLANNGGQVRTIIDPDIEDSGDFFVSIEDVEGSEGADRLLGSLEDNALFGRGGTDTINGEGGDDVISGGEGGDRLSGDAGNDTLLGGPGDDFFAGGPFGVDPNAPPNLVDTTGITFGAGDDRMEGGTGDDTFDDRFGDNTIIGGGGDDTARGGAGADLYVYVDTPGGGGTREEGTGGYDLFEAHDLGFIPDTLASNPDAEDTGNVDRDGDGIDFFDGDAVDFSAFGSAVAILLDDRRTPSSEGRPPAEGGPRVTDADAGTIVGTADKALRNGDAYVDFVTPGAASNRRLLDFAGVENARGTDFDDVIVGSARVNVLLGGDGDDVLTGGDGADIIDGGAGIDVLDYSNEGGGGGIDVTLVSQGGDVLAVDPAPGSAIDTFGATDSVTGIEVVVGTGRGDRIFGGDADETIRPGGGPDTLDGGGGIDTLDLRDLQGAGGAEVVSLAVDVGAGTITATLDTGATETSSFAGFERLLLGPDATVQGGSGPTTITFVFDEFGTFQGLDAPGQDEVIVGGDERNTVEMGAGNDVYVYADGIDTVRGGAGDDLLDLSEASEALFVEIDQGTAAIINDTLDGEDVIVFTGITRVIGTSEDDTLVGDGALGDNLDGGPGDDIVSGLTGDDILSGGRGDDRVSGANGDDTLSGGPGDDTLDGGAGSDLYLVSEVEAGDAATVIFDFSPFEGDVDRLSFAGLGSGVRVAGNVAETDVLADPDDPDSTATEFAGVADFSGIEVLEATGQDDTIDAFTDVAPEDRLREVRAGGGNDAVVVRTVAPDGTKLEGGRIFDGGAGFDIADFTGNGLFIDDFLNGFPGLSARVDLAAGEADAQRAGAADQPAPTVVRNFEGVIGTSLRDVLLGDSNANLFVGGDGQDAIDGRGGSDTVDYGREGGPFGVVVDLSAGAEGALPDKRGGTFVPEDAATDSFGSSDMLFGIENVVGTDQGDEISGSSFDNLLDGGAGDDRLLGLAGDDTLVDGAGVDLLEGGDDNDVLIKVGFEQSQSDDLTLDTLNGGDGLDVLDLSRMPGGLFATLNASDPFFILIFPGLDAPLGDFTIAESFLAVAEDIEGVVGGDFADALQGNVRDNFISGGGGNDFLAGIGGQNTLDGGEGVDFLNYAARVQDDLSNLGGAGATVNLALGTAVGAGFTDRLTSIEGAAGTPGDDELIGDDGANVFNGSAGDDTILGGKGRDVLDYSLSDAATRPDLALENAGMSEDDGIVLYLDGRGDLPDFPVDPGPVSSGGVARDEFGTIDRIFGFEDVFGGRYDDLIVGDDLGNVIEGRRGDDTLTGGDGADTLTGGEGADVFRIAENSALDLITDFDIAEDVLDLSAFERSDVERAILQRPTDEDLLEAGALLFLRDGTTIRLEGISPAEFAAVEAQILADTLVGTAGADSLDGGDGDDTLTGGGGDDTLIGGAGADTFLIVANSDLDTIADFDVAEDVLDLSAFDQTDIEQAIAQRAPGDDTLRLGDGTAVRLQGLSAEDLSTVESVLLAGFAPPQTVPAEEVAALRDPAALSALTAPTLTVVLPEAGLERLTALPSGGTLAGGIRAEELTGLGGDDNILAGGGNDVIDPGPGDDTIEGGTGRDTVTYAGVTSGPVTASLATGEVTGGSGTDRLSGIERLVGTTFGDTLTGSVNPDLLDGGLGADELRPGGGADEITLGFGADRVLGTAADLDGDTITDFDPADTIVIEGVSLGGDTVTLAAGSAVFALDADRDGITDSQFSLSGAFETARFLLSRTPSGDTELRELSVDAGGVLLRDGDDELRTGAAPLLVDGGAGDDTLAAGGDSTLVGGAGDDVLAGAEGGQVLAGGVGDDTLTGGAGPDRFVVDASDTLGRDTITDFVSGTDILHLAGFGLSSIDDLVTLPSGPGVEIVLGDDMSVVLEGLTQGTLSAGDVQFTSPAVAALLDFANDIRLTDAADAFRGGAVDDSVHGGAGDDTIAGGAGDDTATGGAGADTFDVNPGDERLTIRDFELGIDTLDLSDFPREAALDAFGEAEDGSAILTLPDGTVLVVGGEGVSPATLSLDDLVIAPDNAAPEGAVIVTGSPTQGETLAADASALSDPDGLGPFSFAWLRDGAAIAGATEATYTLTGADVGARIAAAVSWTDGGGASERVTSTATAAVQAAGLLIPGTPGPDDLAGGLGADTIEAAQSNDRLTGGPGDDILDGGQGEDTAVYSGDRASYTVTISAAGIAVQDRRSDGDGTDQLSGIESLGFLDQDWPLAIFSDVATLSEDAFREFVEVYIAYFNRAPDAEGLFFYGTAFANGTSLEKAAETFVVSEEYEQTYPADLTNLDFATEVFRNVLGREPDQPGLDFWVPLLDQGIVSPGFFIVEVIRGAKAPIPEDADPSFRDQKLIDQQYLADKTDLGIYFSVTKGMSDVTDAQGTMDLFDGSPASIAAAVDAIDAAHTAALDPAAGEFLLPLVGVVDDPFAI